MDELEISSASEDELRLEVLRLREQLKSMVSPPKSAGYSSPRETWPDDSEANAAIAEAESFNSAIFELIDKYEIPVTGNYARWQDGQFIRELGDFYGDLEGILNRFYGPLPRNPKVPTEG